MSNPHKLTEAPNDLILDDKKNNTKVFKITSSPLKIVKINFFFSFFKEKTTKQKKITKKVKTNGDAKPRLAV